MHLLPCHSCQVLLNDFFLCNCADEFMEAARHFIFETYCRIHHKIDIAMLAEKMVCVCTMFMCVFYTKYLWVLHVVF